ncbi:UNKNOWN [Stylonychia lemnae]|uniref:Uncharacterized protein n=1 Tax=Stylonychia lemnae TaxID=5949 RepID=A0A078BC01_STYLE|nr:UNKNOWN [Stylonychia lemnae]|eukprot:CDW90782.1 UNKNOWN [Stylonychia lemnae]
MYFSNSKANPFLPQSQQNSQHFSPQQQNAFSTFSQSRQLTLNQCFSQNQNSQNHFQPQNQQYLSTPQKPKQNFNSINPFLSPNKEALSMQSTNQFSQSGDRYSFGPQTVNNSLSSMFTQTLGLNQNSTYNQLQQNPPQMNTFHSQLSHANAFANSQGFQFINGNCNGFNQSLNQPQNNPFAQNQIQGQTTAFTPGFPFQPNNLQSTAQSTQFGTNSTIQNPFQNSNQSNWTNQFSMPQAQTNQSNMTMLPAFQTQQPCFNQSSAFFTQQQQQNQQSLPILQNWQELQIPDQVDMIQEMIKNPKLYFLNIKNNKQMVSQMIKIIKNQESKESVKFTQLPKSNKYFYLKLEDIDDQKSQNKIKIIKRTLGRQIKMQNQIQISMKNEIEAGLKEIQHNISESYREIYNMNIKQSKVSIDAQCLSSKLKQFMNIRAALKDQVYNYLNKKRVNYTIPYQFFGELQKQQSNELTILDKNIDTIYQSITSRQSDSDLFSKYDPMQYKLKVYETLRLFYVQQQALANKSYQMDKRTKQTKEQFKTIFFRINTQAGFDDFEKLFQYNDTIQAAKASQDALKEFNAKTEGQQLATLFEKSNIIGSKAKDDKNDQQMQCPRLSSRILSHQYCQSLKLEPKPHKLFSNVKNIFQRENIGKASNNQQNLELQQKQRELFQQQVKSPASILKKQINLERQGQENKNVKFSINQTFKASNNKRPFDSYLQNIRKQQSLTEKSDKNNSSEKLRIQKFNEKYKVDENRYEQHEYQVNKSARSKKWGKSMIQNLGIKLHDIVGNKFFKRSRYNPL